MRTQYLINTGTRSAALRSACHPAALTGLVSVGEVRAEVEDQVQVASLLDAGAHVPEGLLGQRVEVLPVQTQLVALVGPGHQPVDVLVVGGVGPHLWTVDEALDLIGRPKGSRDVSGDTGERERDRERGEERESERERRREREERERGGYRRRGEGEKEGTTCLLDQRCLVG